MVRNRAHMALIKMLMHFEQAGLVLKRGEQDLAQGGSVS